MRPPWSLRFEDGARLTLATMVEGERSITLDGETAVPIRTGDVAVVVGPTPYTIASEPEVPPSVVVRSIDECITPNGRVVDEIPGLWCRPGGDTGGSAALPRGTYQVQSAICKRVLRGLPRTLVVPADALPYPIVDMLGAESARSKPGQQAVPDRLLELLLISTVREWLDRPASGAQRPRACGSHCAGALPSTWVGPCNAHRLCGCSRMVLPT